MANGTETKLPRAMTRAVEDVASFATNAAIDAASKNDSAQYKFAASVTFMMMESQARAIARGDAIDDKTAKTRNGDVWFTMQLHAIMKGVQVWQGTGPDVAKIAEMAGQSKINAAREHIAGKWVLNGEMLSPNIHPDKDSSGRYAGAERKSMVPAFQTCHKLAHWLADIILKNHTDLVRAYAETIKAGTNGDKLGTLTTNDAKAFLAWCKTNIAESFADLVYFYKSGKPKKPAKPMVDRIKNAAKGLTLEELTALATWFEATRLAKANSLADAEAAVANAAGESGEESSDELGELPATGTEG